MTKKGKYKPGLEVSLNSKAASSGTLQYTTWLYSLGSGAYNRTAKTEILKRKGSSSIYYSQVI
jgi:hypothetical protein